MINVGVIGAGYWGPNLIRNLCGLKTARVNKVADFNKDRLEFVKDHYPFIEVTTPEANDPGSKLST